MLSSRILRTLKFFGLQKIAPTTLEIFRFLVVEEKDLKNEGELSKKVSLGEVCEKLAEMCREGIVKTSRGFYALAENADYLEARWLGHLSGSTRERRIRKYAGFLRFLPFVRAVGVTGSQSLGLQKASSDIDLLIIVKPSFLWLSRTLITLYFHVLGVRRYGEYISNRFCLNHYIAGAKYLPENHNWYTAFEYAKIRPIFGQVFLREFQKVNRVWIEKFFPNWKPLYPFIEKKPLVQKALEFILQNSIGVSLDKFLCRLQKPRINLSEKHIVVAEDELSFHPHSKQDSLLERFG